MTPHPLPPVDDERVDAMEGEIFARIAEDRRAARTRRTRGWAWSGAAAAVLALAVVIAPGLTSGLSGARSSSGDVVAVPFPGVIGTSGEAGSMVDPGSGVRLEGGAVAEDGAFSDGAAGAAATDGREIVATGSAAIEVADVAEGVRRVTESATTAGGYVESSQIGSGGVVMPIDGSMPRPVDPSSAWVSVRVPATALSSVMDGLADIGTVTSSSVSRSDVTDQAVDLRARVGAGEASVARLTELIAQAASVADLIAAESALSERQAQLDADRQQLESLEGQVALSTLSVQVQAERETVQADPAGFADGVVAGWNGLVATLNGVVIALGFLLPWIVLAGIAAAIVWGVRRTVRRRRTRDDDAEA